MEIEQRSCAYCGGPIPSSKSKRAKYCKPSCSVSRWQRDNTEEYTKFRKDYQRRYQKGWGDADPRRIMVSSAKRRASKKNVPFDLKPTDFEVPLVCPVLGIPIGRSEGAPSDSSPALDRIIPSLGYVKGNVIVVSNKANRIKTDASLEEIKAVYDFYKNLLEPKGSHNEYGTS